VHQHTTPEPTRKAERTELQNKIIRHWFHDLSALERLAVIFIFDRTWGWNKEWEVITLNHFTQGVFSYVSNTEDPEDLGYVEIFAAPFTRDRTRASKVISELVRKGVVLKRNVKGNPKGLIEYSINANWQPDSEPELPDKFVLKNRSLFVAELEAVKKIEEKEERRKKRRREQRKKARLKQKKKNEGG
jgi:hypothetical protein